MKISNHGMKPLHIKTFTIVNDEKVLSEKVKKKKVPLFWEME